MQSTGVSTRCQVCVPPQSTHSTHLVAARRRRPRARAAQLLAILVLLAVAATMAVVGTPSPVPDHPLVASWQRQLAPSGTVIPDSTPPRDGPTPAPAEPAPAPAESTPAPPQAMEALPEGTPGGVVDGTAPPPDSSVTIPILLYHYIRINPVASDRVGFSLSVTPSAFAEQMALLHADGVQTVSLGDVLRALAGGVPLPDRSVVLTFDDGHDDFATQAVPVLQANGLAATAFVVPGFLGQSSYMTAAQVQAVAGAGMTIGAHTMHHVDLAAVSPGDATEEITESRSILHVLTGQPLLDFAYPYGVFTAAIEAMVEQAGFQDAVGTVPGFRQFASQPFSLRRIAVTGSDNLASFAEKARIPLTPSPTGEAPSPAASAAVSASSPTPTPAPSPVATCAPSPDPEAGQEASPPATRHSSRRHSCDSTPPSPSPSPPSG